MGEIYYVNELYLLMTSNANFCQINYFVRVWKYQWDKDNEVIDYKYRKYSKNGLYLKIVFCFDSIRRILNPSGQLKLYIKGERRTLENND